jgi:hypothetical protein
MFVVPILQPATIETQEQYTLVTTGNL